MDDGRFDAIAVRIGTVGRRGFLKTVAGAGAAVIAAQVGGPAMAAPKAKVEICHAMGNGSFRLMSVAPEALSAHLAHGDGQLGTNANCSACGDTCASDETCQSRVCVSSCTPESSNYCDVSGTCCPEGQSCSPSGCCASGDGTCWI